jgi:hypothetical protein
MTQTSGPAAQPSGAAPGGTQRTVPGRRVLLACLAILSLATAVIHFAVAGEHFAEYWAFGVFMLVVGWFQLAWAVAAVTRPSRLLLAAGAIVNVGVVAVYIVTRTVGDVIGPTPHAVEPFGFGDGLCTVLEGIVVVGCAWLLAIRADRAVLRQQLITAPAVTGAVTGVLLSVALVAGGPDMVMTMASASTPAAHSSHVRTGMAGMHMSATESAADSSIMLATHTPAGDIQMPHPNMQMMAGMRMASSKSCTATPTTAQQRAAVRLVNRSWRLSRRFQSLAVAKADGYQPITPTGLPVVHYLNVSYYESMMRGGPVLNLREPQSLVYANTPRGAVLVASMYITTQNGPTPQPGGCLTQWHLHTNLCVRYGFIVVGLVTPATPTCPIGSVNKITPAMMHVWYVPIPGGPTAIDAGDQQIVRAAERVHSPRNGTA